jgi:NADH:ubiquinone oxidoreductase subunit 3 (subunit A)
MKGVNSDSLYKTGPLKSHLAFQLKYKLRNRINKMEYMLYFSAILFILFDIIIAYFIARV